MSLHMRLARVSQFYTIFYHAPIVTTKNLIIEVNDEVTLNCVLDYAMKGHVRSCQQAQWRRFVSLHLLFPYETSNLIVLPLEFRIGNKIIYE